MSISGNLQTMELAELLQWVAQGARTGTLVIEATDTVKRVYFRDGKIVASGSTLESEQLGHFLVSHGYITDEELTKAIAMQEETGMLLGKILVTIGGISEEELLELLVLQTEESVYDLFTWTNADFRFLDNETLSRGMIPLALDVTAITLQGMNRLDEWSRIRKAISSPHAVPVAIKELDLSSRSAPEQHILSGINDQASIDEIAKRTRTSDFHVSRLMLRELQAGRIKVIEPRTFERPAPRSATPTPDSVAPAAVEPTTDAEEPTTAAAQDSPGEPPSSTDMSVDELAVEPLMVEAVETPTQQFDPGPLRIDGSAICDQGIDHLEQGDLEEALRHLRAAVVLEPRNSKLKEALAQGEDQIREHIHADGLDLSSVPVLERSLEQLTGLQLSPEQGFLLTRIDGSLPIKALLRLSPLDRLDAELVFYQLSKEGHIRLQ